jgi:hypothetical protein
MFHALVFDLVSHPYEQPYLQLPDGTGILGLSFDYDVDTKEGLALVHPYQITNAHAILAAMLTLAKHMCVPFNTHTSRSSGAGLAAPQHCPRSCMDVT